MSEHSPIGFRFDGRPFWAFFGAEGEGDGGGDDGDDDGGAGDGDAKPDQVKAATAPLLRDLRVVRDEYRPVKAVLRDLGIETPEQLREALTKGGSKSGGAQDVDLAKITADAERKAEQTALRRVALAKIEARATGKFADPEDAVNALAGDVEDFLTKDGKVDTKEIDRQLDSLLTRKPHFGTTAKAPSFDGGARTTASGGKGMDDWIRDGSRAKQGR